MPRWLTVTAFSLLLGCAAFFVARTSRLPVTGPPERVVTDIAATPPHASKKISPVANTEAAPAQPAPPLPIEGAATPPVSDGTAAQLSDLSSQLTRQAGAARQRLDEAAKNSGDFKDVLPAAVKRYQEPEAVLTVARAFRDPQWEPMLSDLIGHRWGFDYIRGWLRNVETSLEIDAGFASMRNAQELRVLLQRSEPLFQRRSDELAAKFQLDETVAADAREAAISDALRIIVDAYRYWTVTKNREE